MMCDPVTMGAIAAGATVLQGYQSYQQGKFERGVSEYNARQQENEAIRTRNKGVEQENRLRRQTAELIATQKTQAAASGVDVSSGSALQLQQDSALQGEVDALTLRQNFQDQAQSLDDQAALTRQQGKNAAKAGRNAFVLSIAKAPLAYAATQSAFGETVSPSWYNNNSALNQSFNPTSMVG